MGFAEVGDMVHATVFVIASVLGFAAASNDPPERRRPPKEAVEACRQASQGDACSFEGREGETVNGTCEGPPDNSDKPLACRPAHPPERD